MNTFQKVIKYLALALAFFLIISIFSGIAFGIKSVYYIFNDSDRKLNEFYELPVNGEIDELYIKVNTVKINIKTGEKLKVETNDNYINSKQDNSKITIKEKQTNNWFNKESTELNIYIPSDIEFNKVSINAGAGKVNIEKLTTNILNLELGAGKLSIDNLKVLGKTDINGGAGSIIIKDGEVSNLDLDLGVGKVEFNTTLLGNNDIDCGVGEFILNVKEKKDNYKIFVDKGIGTFKINNDSIKDDTIYGTGNNIIKIDGGIGNIKVNFVD